MRGAWNGPGIALSLQPGRERESIAAYRRAIADGDAGAWLNLGNLLAAQRGRDGNVHPDLQKALDRQGDSVAHPGVTELARLGTRIARQGWARPVSRSVWWVGRLGPELASRWRRARRRSP